MYCKKMNVLLATAKILAGYALLFSVSAAKAQNPSAFASIPLNNLDAFEKPGSNWQVCSDAIADVNKSEHLKPVKGTGVLANQPDKKNQSHLVTKEQWGDMELELEFMMARHSNSGVYLQGRYEIQLYDSWTKIHPAAIDCGAIYFRWSPERQNYEGRAPSVNASRAPGLWQKLQIRFRAPRFDAFGKKIANARFEEVYLNGTLVQEDVDVTGPTRSSLFEDEKPMGPIMIQGDHGPVAIKNIRYRSLSEKDSIHFYNTPDQRHRKPFYVEPGAEPRVQRSFTMHGNQKLTHVISTGYPSKLNYSYDIKRGALFKIWRGDYLDVAEMWLDRGFSQNAYPRGAVISLSDAPAVAVLQQPHAAWPDSIGFDDLKELGYNLTAERSPVFQYEYSGMTVTDSIAPAPEAQGFVRKLSIQGANTNAYCRVTTAAQIEKISDDLYAIDGKSYYLRIAPGFKPVIRQSGANHELLLSFKNGPVQYSIIW